MTSLLHQENQPFAPQTADVPVHVWRQSLEQSAASRGAKAVGQCLGNFTNNCSDAVWPAIRTIGQKTGYTDRAVLGFIKELEGLKLIAVERRRYHEGRRLSNQYRLLIPISDGSSAPTAKLRLVVSDTRQVKSIHPVPRAQISPDPGEKDDVLPGEKNDTRTIHKRTIQGDLLGPTIESERPAKRSRSARQGTSLEDDWDMPEDWIQRARMRFATVSEQDVRAAAVKFGRYWKTRPGDKGVMRRWDLVWDNWCDTEWKPGKRHGQPMNWPRNAYEQRSGRDVPKTGSDRLREIEKLAGDAQ